VDVNVLLREAEESGVFLYVENNKLKYQSKQNGLPEKLKQNLKEHKEQIIRQLIVESDSLQAADSIVPKIEAGQEDVSHPIVLSYGQQRMWFLNQLMGPNSVYNIPLELRFSSELDSKLLIQCLVELVARHQVLQTSFRAHGDDAVQVIDSTRFELQLENIETKQEITHICESEKNYQFDLSQDQLCRIRFIRDISSETFLLLITMHHSITDGWSQGILLHDLKAMYQSLNDSNIAPLEPLPIQYSDFSDWQRNKLSGRVFQAQLAYWKKQLSGVSPVLALPTDRPRPKQQTYNGRLKTIQLTKKLSADIDALGAQHGTTLFISLLSVFSILLSRYSGQNDIVVGTPIANRTRQETEGLIGLFVNTLVLRSDLSLDQTFEDFLEQTKIMVLQSYDNQDVPFEMLVDELNPQRNLSYSPLFQVLFVLQNAPVNSDTKDNMDLTDLILKAPSESEGFSDECDGHNVAHFDLTLSLIQGQEGIAGAFEYNTDLFDEQTIQKLSDYFILLLEKVISNPKQRLSHYECLSNKQKQQLILTQNNTRKIYSHEECVHQVFERQAETFSKNKAIVFKGQSVSYCELNQRANQLAHYLMSKGVGPEVRVGLCLERSLEMMVGILAVVKAGGCYVPIDADYPVERISYMLQDSDCRLVLSQQVMAPLFGSLDVVTVLMDSESVGIQLKQQAQHNVEANSLGLCASNLAYIIYTSGSTGTPKGSAITHQNINRLVHGDYFDFSSQQNLLCAASVSFDAFTFEFWGSLLHGARCVLTDLKELSFQQLGQLIRAESVTGCWLTSSFFNRVISEAPEALATLDYLLVGGEALSKEHVKLALQKLPNTKIINGYGPTENTTFTCTYLIPNLDFDVVVSVPIGKPISNTSCYIMDQNGQLVLKGAVGELCIGGDGVSRGYNKRVSLSAEKFVPNPFGNTPGERLYRTGDLVRYDQDGNIQFIGRIDNQVKIRGFRIELGEIAAVLRKHVDVEDAVVMVSENEVGNKSLVAYILQSFDVKNSDLQIDKDSSRLVEQLRCHTQALLPEHMLPTSFVILKDFPLTANGKLDRQALPKPSLLDEKATYVPPDNEIESQLCGIWQELLAAERIGVEDNFFSSGGDSILSIQVVSRARALDLELSVKQLFEHQTIRQLARVVKTRVRDIEQTISNGEMLLLPIQHWYLSTHGENPERFHQSQLVEVPDSFSLEFLRQFTHAIYQRHDALRLTFEQSNNLWNATYNSIDGSMIESSLTTISFDEKCSKKRQQQIVAAGENVKSEFNIAQGPLLKFVYFNADQTGQSRLLMVIHHLIVDGVSWRILFDDLILAFNQWSVQKNIVLPPKTSAFQAWGDALKEYSNDSLLLRERKFWSKQLAPAISILPSDRHSTNKDTYANSESVSIEFTQKQTSELLTRCGDAYRTQIQDLLLAGLLRAFKTWTGQQTLRINLESHGRENLFKEIDLSETLGWFTSVYPLMLGEESAYANGECSITDTIKLVKEQLRSVPNGGIGYGVLRYLAKDQSLIELEKTQPTQVVFNYLGQFDQQMGTTAGFIPLDQDSASDISEEHIREHSVGFNGVVSSGCLRFLVDFNPECHDRKTIEDLTVLYSDKLKEIIEHCTKQSSTSYTPSDFSLVKKLDQSLLNSWQSIYPTLENIYPATGMQQGFIFHSLLDEQNEAYASQLYLDFQGNFNPNIFQQAWAEILTRHPIFRTAFVGFERAQPLQIVSKDVNLDWSFEDWQDLNLQEKTQAFERYRGKDKRLGFDFSRAPLMRMSIFQMSDDSYRWLWTHHHSILDGWSVPIIFRELFTCYVKLKSNSSEVLPSVTPYSEYVSWLEAQQFQQAQAFWKQELFEVTLPTSLGVDNLPIESKEALPQESCLKLPGTLTASLQSLALQQSVPFNSVIQAAWSILVSRYSGKREVVFGQTVSGRPGEIEGVENMIGLFINTIPIRVSVNDELSITDWIKELHSQHVTRESFGYLPLVEIKSAAGISSSQNLFDSLLVVQNYPTGEGLKSRGSQSSDELDFDITAVGSDIGTDYGLTLIVIPGEEIELKLGYSSGSYEQATIDRLLTHLQSIFAAMINPEIKCLKQIQLLTDCELTYQIESWNNTQTDIGNHDLLHTIFEKQALENPNNVSIICDELELSYTKVNEKANRVAHYLIQQGVEPESIVALYFDSSSEMIIGLLGVLKAGGAYMPLDPGYPSARINYMLQDSGAKHILSMKKLSEKLSDSSKFQLILFDELDDENRLISFPKSNPNILKAGLQGDHLAYVIYTSGSTGVPKGVMITHNNVINYLAHGNTYMRAETTGSVVSTSLVFDATVCSLFVPLLTGKTIEVLSQNSGMLEQLIDCLEDDSENLLFKLTPAHLKAMLNTEFLRNNQESQHVFVIGGEQLIQETLSQWQALLPKSTFINEYGPTEATVGCCVFDATESVGSDVNKTTSANDIGYKNSDVPIGTPILNTELFVVSDNFNIQPLGVAGELSIAGSGLSRGYLNRPSLTAEKFVPNPYSKKPGERMYLSGDIVRHLPKGVLQYSGRIDEQVKIQGKRIELGEIECHLTQLPEISESIVVARELDDSEASLVAYLVATDHSLLEVSESDGNINYEKNILIKTVKTQLAAKLPDYMVPEVYVLLEKLPLTTNGKIDKNLLRRAQENDLLKETYVGPRNESEKQLCKLWQELLNLGKVGIDDNFFSLGGHSILATRLISSIREIFSVELSLRALFDSPTIKSLSESLETLETKVLLPPISNADRDKDLPLSFAQQRLWFIDQLGDGSVQYNMRGAFSISGTIDLSAFKQALKGMLDRHEVLRTHFQVFEGEAIQIIKREYNLPLKEYDLSHLTQTEKAAKVQEVFQQEADSVFDLGSDLMLRVRLLKLADSAHLILHTMHHIASDGWSMGLFEKEFRCLYEAFKRGQSNPFEALQVQYADYALWQREWLQGEVLQQQLDYWKKQLKDVPQIHNLPLDHKRPTRQSFRGKVHQQHLDANLTAQIISLCDKHEVTLFMFLETAFTLLLSRYSDEEDIVIGSAVEGRSHKVLEKLVGFFINSVVLRTDLSGNPTFSELLERNKKVILDAYAHQHVPFEMLVEEIRPERNLSYNPLFQMMFAVRTITEEEINEQDLLEPAEERLLNELENAHVESSTTRSDLQLQLTNMNGVLSVSWVYNQSLFNGDTIEKMAGNFDVLLQDIAVSLLFENNEELTQEKRLDELKCHSKTQQETLLKNGHGMTQDYFREKCLHQRFEEQVVKTPDSVAVEVDGEEITYRDLNQKSNQLARYLVKQGVKENTIVGLCLENSIEMLIGIIGILKSGGAYIPLDPTLPATRLSYMLDDCEVKMVLTQQELLGDLSFGDCKVLPLDEEVLPLFVGNFSNENITSDEQATNSEQLAYVIYTSGSTGKPKGVLVSHKAASCYLEAGLNSYYQRDLDGSYIVTSYSVDMTIPGLYLPLFCGNKVQLSAVGVPLDSLARKLLNTSERLLLRLTPSHVVGLLALLPSNQKLTNQHIFVIGGEPLYGTIVSKLVEVFTHASITNHYGPTEAVVGCVINQDIQNQPEQLRENGSVAIGKAMQNVELFVLDEQQRLQLPGSIGELAVGGEGLAKGYLNDEALTSEKFIPNHFTRFSQIQDEHSGDLENQSIASAPNRLYRTGDLVRWLPDGKLVFVGRIDDQVKVRGFRIEIGDIESSLKAIDNIKESAVIISEFGQQESSLIAYVVPDRGIEGEDDLEVHQEKAKLIKIYREKLSQELPDYMVPRVYVFLEKIPLTANGKVNKTELPMPQETDLHSETYAAPTNQMEKRLCQLWCEILKLEQVGIHDNFFSLGGHSLLATSLISLIRQEFEVELQLIMLFEFPTVLELSNILETKVFNEKISTLETEEFIL